MSGDFLNESRVYEDLQDVTSLRKFMETQLEDYNLTPGVVPMSLVLFRDAIEHSASESTTHTSTHTPTPIFYGQYTVLKTPLMHQPSSSTPQSILEHITTINARGPLLFSGVSLLSSPFSSFMILAQFETPLKNAA